jgi:hypothetical protein
LILPYAQRNNLQKFDQILPEKTVDLFLLWGIIEIFLSHITTKSNEFPKHNLLNYIFNWTEQNRVGTTDQHFSNYLYDFTVSNQKESDEYNFGSKFSFQSTILFFFRKSALSTSHSKLSIFALFCFKSKGYQRSKVF